MLLRCAILLIALWQVATAAVPHTGSYAGATAGRPHLHAPGDRLEYAHDEALCPNCSAHQATLGAPSMARPWAEFVHTFSALLTADDQPVFSSFVAFVSTRGPPVLS